MRARGALVLGVFAWALVAAHAGCNMTSWIQFLTPRRDAQLTWMPVGVVLDFDVLAPPETLEVLLNGNDVTAAFTLDPPQGGRVRAHADALWGPGFVLPGANLLEASIADYTGTRHAAVSFTTEGDPYPDDVVSFAVGTSGGFNQGLLPGIVLGPPRGAGLFEGSLDTVSLGLDGEIELEFVDNVIVDGPGVDFTVFENPILELVALVTQPPFSEPGRVSVSQDGVVWYTFPCALDLGEAPYHPGCAGVYPVLTDGEAGTPHASVPTLAPPIEDLVGVSVIGLPVPEGSGGDSFDLADVGLSWARFVRVEAAGFVDGPSGPDNAAFDLDGMAAVHSAPATDDDDDGIPDAVE